MPWVSLWFPLPLKYPLLFLSPRNQRLPAWMTIALLHCALSGTSKPTSASSFMIIWTLNSLHTGKTGPHRLRHIHCPHLSGQRKYTCEKALHWLTLGFQHHHPLKTCYEVCWSWTSPLHLQLDPRVPDWPAPGGEAPEPHLILTDPQHRCTAGLCSQPSSCSALFTQNCIAKQLTFPHRVCWWHNYSGPHHKQWWDSLQRGGGGLNQLVPRQPAHYLH